jgi:cyanophycinase
MSRYANCVFGSVAILTIVTFLPSKGHAGDETSLGSRKISATKSGSPSSLPTSLDRDKFDKLNLGKIDIGPPHVSDTAHNTASRHGTCVIIGGALRADNAAIFQRLIQGGGGIKKCRFVVFPSASHSVRGAVHFADVLRNYEIPSDRIAVIDIRPENSSKTAYDEKNVAEIRRATIVYFAGGEQERILYALRKPSGGDTPALAAIREVFNRGGAVAGSSAGAAVQGPTMISAAGLRRAGLDEGMDALDFGLTSDDSRRGLLVTSGLDFFHGGIVDQHFNQTRGRLGRLARAAAEKKIHIGFGIDENTALVVGPDGAIEVVGAGCVTIVDASAATCADGPLGCSIHGLRISCIETGDRFDPKTGTITANPAKEPDVEDDWKSNNHLITDINAAGAVPYALFSGLIDNAAPRQVGVAFRFSHSFGHGYRFTFQKPKTMRIWSGVVNSIENHAIQNAALDIEPVVSTLQPPESVLPVDLTGGSAAAACKAVWFRGVMLADEQRRFRPDAPLTRGDLATAIAQAVHLDAPENEVRPADVPETASLIDEVGEVVDAKIMELDGKKRFRPDAAVTWREATVALLRAAEFGPRSGGFRPDPLSEPSRPITRREAAVALGRLMELSW